jgi:UDP-glucose 4-epimerase
VNAEQATALVTGGAGFIGAHLVDHLVDQMGMSVTVLDDLSGGFKENVHPKAHFVEGSIVDDRLVKELFAQTRFDYVYHLAAYAAEGLSHFIKTFNYTNNLLGSVNLINASVNTNVKCFVFTSSIAVYGANQVPMREDTRPEPEDPYGIAKYAVEMELAVSKAMFGLDYVVFRPHNVYGERQNIGDRYRNVIGIFMNNLLLGRVLPIFGDGEQRRAFTYIGDIIPGIARSVLIPEARNKVFNIGSDTHHSVKDLAQLVIEAMGIRGEIKHVEPRNEVRVAYSDHTEYQRVIGLSQQTSLADGLRRMAGWVRTAGARQSKSFGKIEIEKNLPRIWTEQS